MQDIRHTPGRLRLQAYADVSSDKLARTHLRIMRAGSRPGRLKCCKPTEGNSLRRHLRLLKLRVGTSRRGAVNEDEISIVHWRGGVGRCRLAGGCARRAEGPDDRG